jgi:hypothetical protein
MRTLASTENLVCGVQYDKKKNFFMINSLDNDTPSSSDLEDDYYQQLQDAADAETEPRCDMKVYNLNDAYVADGPLTECEYYDRVLAINVEATDGSYLEEDHAVWKHILRDVTPDQPGFHPINGSSLCLPGIKEWLFLHLPLSSVFFHSVSEIADSHNSLLVDDERHPAIIMLHMEVNRYALQSHTDCYLFRQQLFLFQF